MPTFIDESGCCGFEPGSKPYFRLAAVWFETGDDADACRAAIEQFRQDRRLPERYEFKYSGIPDDIKAAFFEAIRGHNFAFVVTHFDKLVRPGCVDKIRLYEACTAPLVAHLSAQYQIAEEFKAERLGRPVRLAEKVIPDDNHDAAYLRVLKGQFFSLTSVSGRTLVGEVKFGKSKADRLLQLADMICGAVGDHVGGDSSHFSLIAGHALHVAVLPTKSDEAGG